MAKSTTEQKVKAQTKKITDGINHDDLVMFLQGEKVNNLLNELYVLALESEDEKIKVDSIKDLLDRYFGKATQKLDNTSSDGSFKNIFIGNLKE